MKRLNADEIIICNDISNRAITLGVYTEEEKIVALRDVMVTAEVREIKIEEWLHSNDEDFLRDITNIKENINDIDEVGLKFATI